MNLYESRPELTIRVYFGSLEDAEMSKVASNMFQGLILSAWNEIKVMCPEIDSQFVMETLVQEAPLASLKRFHGKAFGKSGRMDPDLRAYVSGVKPGYRGISVFSAALGMNDYLRSVVGEENRPTDELKKLAFTGRVTPSLKES